MATPYLGQLKLVAFNYAPRGWALCDGQLMPINQNQALFALLGTSYGGDGVQTFGLPDLRGRVPGHQGPDLFQALGELGGTESVTLLNQNIPEHVHSSKVQSGPAATSDPSDGFLATAPLALGYVYGSGIEKAGPSVEPTGGSQPHENRQPSLVLNYIIALQGIFPSRN